MKPFECKARKKLRPRSMVNSHSLQFIMATRLLRLLSRRLPLLLSAGALLSLDPDLRHLRTLEMPEAGSYRQGLPEYTREEVGRHKTYQDRIWITYKRGVYDVTSFLERHPGGKKLLLAAGAAADPFWTFYSIHKRPDIFQMLESMRIGNLKASERQIDLSDPYFSDPLRHASLHPLSLKPYNAEADSEILLDGPITPNEVAFVRNHLPVPDIDPEQYELEIGGEGFERPVKLSLLKLRTDYKLHTIAVTIQCAGNRRAAMEEVAPVKGLQWGAGAISTAQWTGVLLSEVLARAGVTTDTAARHVCFQGYDADPGGNYEASIPISRALNPYDEVLLAFEMNGEVIPRDHGFPVRVIVPGVAGVRNVKWVRKVSLSKQESETVWQRRDYKVFPGSVDLATVDYDSAPSIQELPVNSAILSHKTGDVVTSDSVNLSGYAISGGGREIHRVEVTTDQGSSWTQADITHLLPSPSGKTWTWTHWKAQVALESQGEVTACVRAVDAGYNTQPKSLEEVWNFRGLLNNSWHCVKLNKQ